MLKYFLQYQDVVDITHRWELFDDNYTGSPIEINGAIFLDAAETENPLESIRGQGLRVELEANTIITFEDLFTEEQRSFQVFYIRDGSTEFNGWLNPEGWFENYVTDKWIVSFDCVDGQGFLQDLSFVDDATGLHFVGIKTQLEILSLALIRTGLQQNINVDIQIFYTGLSTSLDILDNVKARVTRYIKDDQNTIMSCDEVIRDVLEPYGACITSHKGEWFIYKPNQLFLSPILTYFRYDYLGVALSPTTGTKDISFSLGSQVDGFLPHHCSGNQSILNKNSLGAYRVNYKYGEARSLLDNPFFINNGVTIDDWTITSGTNLTLESPSGVTFLGPTGVKVTIENLTTEIIGLSQDDIFILRYRLNCTLPIGAGWEMDWEFQIISTDAAGTGASFRYLKNPGVTEWGTDTTIFTINPTFTGGEILFESTFEGLPQDGKIVIKLLSASTFGGAPVAFDLELTEFSIEPIAIGDINIEGEFHTVQREDKPSKEVNEVKEVATGDTATDLFVGTLYKADGNTPTMTWFRDGITEDKPILQIMGEETLRLNASVSRVFSGDVFGFFDYLSLVTISGVDGLFMPIAYSYDTKNNIISAQFRRIYGDELTDIDYQLTFDYGKTVKPTIIG